MFKFTIKRIKGTASFLFTSSLSDFDLLKKKRNEMMEEQQTLFLSQLVEYFFTAFVQTFIFIMLS